MEYLIFSFTSVFSRSSLFWIQYSRQVHLKLCVRSLGCKRARVWMKTKKKKKTQRKQQQQKNERKKHLDCALNGSWHDVNASLHFLREQLKQLELLDKNSLNSFKRQCYGLKWWQPLRNSASVGDFSLFSFSTTNTHEHTHTHNNDNNKKSTISAFSNSIMLPHHCAWRAWCVWLFLLMSGISHFPATVNPQAETQEKHTANRFVSTNQ